MADIDGTGYKKGDLLHGGTDGTTFKYCVTGSGCNEATRPSSPIQNSDIANFTNTNEGNKTIPSFFINPPSGATAVQVKKSDLESPTSANIFTIDFSLTDGVKFTTAASTWDTVDEIVSAFQISAEPGDQDSGFTATITYSTTAE